MFSRPDPSEDPRRGTGGVDALLAGGLCLAVVVLLAMVREPLYRVTAGLGDALPGPIGTLVEVVGEGGLLALVGATVLLAWQARGHLRRVAVVVSCAATAVAAYALSELVKVLVSEERPCRTLHVSTLATCPPAGDWSWPSNHSVIAASLATVVVVLAPAWWRYAVPAALAVGASRVITGAHYWHDVATGFVVGVLVVWFGTWALVPVVHRFLRGWLAADAPGVVHTLVGVPRGSDRVDA